jgi:hypothetical protein
MRLLDQRGSSLLPLLSTENSVGCLHVVLASFENFENRFCGEYSHVFLSRFGSLEICTPSTYALVAAFEVGYSTSYVLVRKGRLENLCLRAVRITGPYLMSFCFSIPTSNNRNPPMYDLVVLL